MKIPLPQPTRKTAMVPSTCCKYSFQPLHQTASTASSEEQIYQSMPDNMIALPIPHPEEPTIYKIPPTLFPAFRPLPSIWKLILAICSSLLAIQTTWGLKWLVAMECLPQSLILRWLKLVLGQRKTWEKLSMVVFQSFVFYVLGFGILQDALPSLRPSRISTKELEANYYLPSTLSRYTSPSLHEDESANPLGIHWLEYYDPNQTETTMNDAPHLRLDAIYLNHGFGASSLSWIPVISMLAKKLRVLSVLGHDAPGLGFTDRPKELSEYTFQHSAKIAVSLLQRKLISTASKTTNRKQFSPHSSVLLIGHSMGSLTTLHMALQLNPAIQQHIVLVSPALGLLNTKDKQRLQDHNRKKSKRILAFALLSKVTMFVKLLIIGITSYVLRRVVGRPHFWRNGLRWFVWADSNRLRDSDVLRYQWPAIAKGWEKGLIHFSLAQATISSQFSDRKLLQAVLDLPNVRSVNVISGTKDRVITKAMVSKFFELFPEVKVMQVDDVGHDPFEENAAAFTDALFEILRESCKVQKSAS